MCGAPADAATSRSPVASMTTSPRIAWRPLLVSQTTPVMRPSSTSACENHECRRSSMPLLAPPSRARPASSRRGRTRRRRRSGAACPGCGSRTRPSASSAAWPPARLPHSSWRGNSARPRAARRSIRSRQTPRTEISCSARVPHVVEHQHHAARGQAAEVVVALEQDGRGAVARRGDRRRHAGRAAADDDHVGRATTLTSRAGSRIDVVVAFM